jgi:alpha-beta hydrolase superfamily lysophospholipase
VDAKQIAKRAGLYLLVAILGFVLGAVALYIIKVRGGPDLELWHIEEVTAEFTTRRADEIPSFEAYLQLEDELFAELDERVYAHVGTGPAFALKRYSSGSAADPRRWERNWNRSFELPAVDPAGGVLLLHGMSDSPYSLRALGEELHQQGYWVVGLRLPGHGTLPAGMKTLRWEDMAAVVRLGIDHLASKVGLQAIHIIGYSTGAPLALDFTLAALDGEASPTPSSLVLISPAIGITPAAALAKWKARFALLPGLKRLAWTGIQPEFDPFKYNSFTANAGYQVHRLTRRVARALEARADGGLIEDFPPTLVFLSTVDATVSVDAVVDNLLEHLGPDRHELVLYDFNREKVNTSVLVADPGPLTARLMANDDLPFALTLITNEHPESPAIVRRSKPSMSAEIVSEEMGASWPAGMISLSHVALPFPPDDPLYGRGPAPREDLVFLGQMDIRGERGLLRFPSDWLMRLRHNPFYDYQETWVLEWLGNSGRVARSDR